MGEQEIKTGSVCGVGTTVKGKRWGKGVGGCIWCKYCVHIYVNGKMKPVQTIPGIVGGGIKENDRLNNTILWYI
jgi:hypothetical protein